MNLNKNVNFEFKPFLRWWRRELAFLIPAKMSQFFYTPQPAIIIKPIDNTIELSYEIKGVQHNLGTVTCEISQQETVKNLLSDERFKNAIFILRLSNQETLNKTLNLPLAAQTNVSQVVSYEIDRYSPFKIDQIYFATHLENIDTETSQLSIRLMIVQRKLLEKRYKDCKMLGISPQFVEVEHYPNDLQNLHLAYNLLPLDLQPKIKNRSRWIIGSLMTALIFLIVISLVLPVWIEYQEVENLQKQISSVEKEVKAVKLLQAEMDEIREENQALINEKIASPPVVAILNEISALLKDDSWLSYLQYSDGQLQLQGESPTASNLLADLEASDYFAKVSFASPVTQDKASGSERFQITAEITKPETIENSDATTETTVDSTNDEITVDEATEETEAVVTEDDNTEE
jgi:general secretion pathway protein L